MFGAARRIGAWLALALFAIVLFGGSPSAQEPSAAERATLQSRKEALFQQMLRDPANLDIIFAYADVAAKLGDNEAAVSALERMLLFNPDLRRVQLELGALYFRMGSYEISRTYFEKALAGEPPPEVRSRVETYLAEISRLSSPHRFSGSVSYGAQYQSNASLGPSSQIPIPGGFATLPPEFAKRADVNIFGTGSVLYEYDLGSQERDTVEVAGAGFADHHFEVGRLDLGIVEATAGPRFNFTEPASGIRAVSLKPYVIANYVNLGSDPYFYTIGVGGETAAAIWHDFRLRSFFEFRNKNFQNAPDRPLSRGLTGSDKLFSLFLAKPITAVPDSEFMLEVDLLRQDTRLDFYANWTYGGVLAYRVRYDDPTGFLRSPWETTVFFSGRQADYDAPQQGISTNARSDRRLRFGLTQSFQVVDKVELVVLLQREIVSSNVPLYSYNNSSILIGPRIRF